MNEEEKKKLREQRRAASERGVTPVTPAPLDGCAAVDVARWNTRNDPCSDPVVCDPTVFVKPAAKVETTQTEYATPNPVVVGNTQVTLSCPDGKFGQAVVVGPNIVTTEFDWRAVPDIRPEQLDYISRIPDSEDFILKSVEDVMLTARLSVTQSEFVVSSIAASLFEMQEAAQFAAYQALDCWFENDEFSIQCPEGALTSKVDGGPPVQFSVVVPAGAFRSYNSKEDADLMAMLEGQSSLFCAYGNDGVTKNCYPDYDDSDPGIKGGPYSVEIPPNKFFSTESKAEANRLASDVALSSLDCWYENTTYTLECETKADVSREVTFFGVNKVFTISASYGGSSVTIPAGRIISRVSTAAANEEAASLASGSVSCLWSNIGGVFTCDEGANADKTQSGSVTLTPDTFVSVDTADNVLDQVEGFLGVALQCIYCNDEIPPLCNELSLEYTYGVAANVVCASTKEEAMAVATSVANRPRLSGAASGSCLYGNDDVTVSCTDKVPNTTLEDFDPASTLTITIPANAYQIRSLNPSEGKSKAQALAYSAALAALYCFFSSPGGTYLCEDPDIVSVNSIGSRKNPIIVPRGTFTSMASAGEALAQEQAYAESLLDCYYDNDRIVMLCGDPGTNTMSDVSPEASGSSARPVIIEEATYQSHTSKEAANNLALTAARTMLDCFLLSDPHTFTCESIGRGGPGLIPTPPLEFPRGFMRTYVSREQLEADLLFAAKSMLQCYYTNDPMQAPPCGEGLVQIGSGGVPGGTIISPLSKEQADNVAAMLAESMQQCMDPDDVKGDDGSPGNDGTQKDCQGQCFGFYS